MSDEDDNNDRNEPKTDGCDKHRRQDAAGGWKRRQDAAGGWKRLQGRQEAGRRAVVGGMVGQCVQRYPTACTCSGGVRRRQDRRRALLISLYHIFRIFDVFSLCLMNNTSFIYSSYHTEQDAQKKPSEKL
jgi:hypothetical protein